MRFRNREEAARLLAHRLQHYRSQHPLVLGLPRGGMTVAKIVADGLGGDLDVILIEKLPSPIPQGPAIGAVDEDGNLYISSDDVCLGLEELEQLTRAEADALRQRRQFFAVAHAPVPIRGRVVIAVDEGVATGVSLVAAIRSIRGHRPRRVVAAVPVAPAESLRLVKAHADDVACLHTPKVFRTIRAFYDDFPPVSDATVLRLLSASGSSQLPV